MDGNTAAAHTAYAFTDVAAIYPITPSSTMAEYIDKWASEGRKNIFGQTVRVIEMQSEGGAAGAVHGSTLVGAMTSTFTASQGLLLMIPNLYKLAGERLPAVLHVSARTLASHALSIFGDHQDIYACRQTGVAMVASNSPQEAMDLAAAAHLAAIDASSPFIHFFDGFRTSHEMRKIEVWDYDDLSELLKMENVASFHRRANVPAKPVLRGSAQNGDIFFQAREASNSHYDAIADTFADVLERINAKIGTDYKPFNYYGAPDAENVIVAMGSVCDTAEEVVDYLNANGGKTGLIKVRLYRPFSAKHLLSVLPKSVKKVAVLDRTKEPGGVGEPLYLDVRAVLDDTGVKVVGGRYGLASKDTTPGAVLSVFENLKSDAPKNNFTIGINDDVTNLSLPISEEPDTLPPDVKSCKFWGLGSDGTVGATKNSITIIGDHTDMNVQAYFQYDSRKSGGVTISHLRFGNSKIKAAYYISKADFVACHNQSYLDSFLIAQDVRPGGAFLINTAYTAEELGERLPASQKRYIAKNNVRVYTVDAVKISRDLGLGNKTNAVLQAAFFKLSGILPIDKAADYMKQAVRDTYGRKGEKIVNMNISAIDAGLTETKEITVPADWASASGEKAAAIPQSGRTDCQSYIENVQIAVNNMLGDTLPVSAFLDTEGGSFIPLGTSAYEKRGTASDAPEWIPENCIQCNRCAYVCPHSVVRPFAASAKELASAPAGVKSVKMLGKGNEDKAFTLQTSVLDCTGCGSCANVCPAKNKALVMRPLDEVRTNQKYFDWAVAEISEKETGFDAATVKGSQFKQPYLEFPGACAGCGETPYAKLITQLFGDRMFIANATGCSSIWAGSAPSTPYTVDKNGKGPAWANSLFEDNAEFGLGIQQGMEQRRELAKRGIEECIADDTFPDYLQAAARAVLANWDDAEGSKKAVADFTPVIEQAISEHPGEFRFKLLYLRRDLCVKPSVWIFGGDGWAYDIGYGGLDHVLASGENVNVFVFDTEVYSNTGGQASKSTPTGAVAQFAASGKNVKKKDLAKIAMSYGYVYVAQIAMGADYNQTLAAIREAESYNGPSLIIAYAPCINHGLKAGMHRAMDEMKSAVDCGYWNLLRFDPRNETAPLTLDSKEPDLSKYRDFLLGEVRYSSLTLTKPERADKLFALNEKNADDRFKKLKQEADAQ
jgi:pyruvate-ferredoxin/flavodoxin oxidoreductase